MFVLGVEVDESLIGRRKYNRGRMVKGKWILGGTVPGQQGVFPGRIQQQSQGSPRANLHHQTAH